MAFTSLTTEDRDAMLAAIGVSSVEELFREIVNAIKAECGLSETERRN